LFHANEISAVCVAPAATAAVHVLDVREEVGVRLLALGSLGHRPLPHVPVDLLGARKMRAFGASVSPATLYSFK
jgi:hypothetical protein